MNRWGTVKSRPRTGKRWGDGKCDRREVQRARVGKPKAPCTWLTRTRLMPANSEHKSGEAMIHSRYSRPTSERSPDPGNGAQQTQFKRFLTAIAAAGRRFETRAY